jgi:hypothetical protein
MNKPPADTYKVYKLYFIHTVAHTIAVRQQPYWPITKGVFP